MVHKVYSRNIADKLFVGILLITQIYYGYRYAFQYGDSNTSTYSDTPTAFQAGKYIIVILGVFGITLLSALNSKTARPRLQKSGVFIMALLFIFFVYASLIALYTSSRTGRGFEEIYLIKALFIFPLLFLIPLHFSAFWSIDAYFKAIVKWGMIYHLAYTIIMLAAFIFAGRIPGLSWPGGITRFGGGWDDPNAFGVFLLLPLLTCFALKSSWKKGAALLVVSSLILLTLSFTAIAACIAGVFFYAFLRNAMARLFGALIFLIVIGYVGYLSFEIPSGLLEILAYKQESAESHISQFSIGDLLAENDPIKFLFGDHDELYFNESFYVALMVSHGLFGLLLLITIILLTLANAIVKIKFSRSQGDERANTYISIMASFVFGFAVACNATPQLVVFPGNLYFWVCVVLIWLTPTAAINK